VPKWLSVVVFKKPPSAVGFAADPCLLACVRHWNVAAAAAIVPAARGMHLAIVPHAERRPQQPLQVNQPHKLIPRSAVDAADEREGLRLSQQLS
jgi:hypothetical protein